MRRPSLFTVYGCKEHIEIYIKAQHMYLSTFKKQLETIFPSEAVKVKAAAAQTFFSHGV